MSFIVSLSTAPVTGTDRVVARLCLQPEVRWSQWPPSERSYELQNESDHLLNFLSFWWIIRSLLRAENRISFSSEILNFPPLGLCRPGAAATLAPPHHSNHTPVHRKPLSAGDSNSVFIQQFHTAQTLQQRRLQRCSFGGEVKLSSHVVDLRHVKYP